MTLAHLLDPLSIVTIYIVGVIIIGLAGAFAEDL